MELISMNERLKAATEMVDRLNIYYNYLIKMKSINSKIQTENQRSELADNISANR